MKERRDIGPEDIQRIEGALNRRLELADQIESAGVNRGEALRALVSLAYSYVSVRGFDMVHPLSRDEADEVGPINKVAQFGFDPHDGKGLERVRQALLNLHAVIMEEDDKSSLNQSK